MDWDGNSCHRLREWLTLPWYLTSSPVWMSTATCVIWKQVPPSPHGSKGGRLLTTEPISIFVTPSVSCMALLTDVLVQIKFPGVNMCQNKVLLPFDIRGESNLASCPSSSIHPLLSHLCWSVWHKKVGVTPYNRPLMFIESLSIEIASAWVKHYSQSPVCQGCVPAPRPGLPECEIKQVIHFPVRPTVAALSFIITVKQKVDENNSHFYALGPILPHPLLRLMRMVL